MNDQGVGPGLREIVEKQVGVGDHEVNFQRHVRDRPQPPDDVWPEREIGHEMTVHHVDVNPVGPSPLRLGHLLSQARRVSRKNRRGKLDGDVVREGGHCG